MGQIIDQLKEFKWAYRKTCNFNPKKHGKLLEDRIKDDEIIYSLAAKVVVKKGRKKLAKNAQAAIAISNDFIYIGSKGFVSSVFEKLPKEAFVSISQEIKMFSASLIINLAADLSIEFPVAGRLVPFMAEELEKAFKETAPVAIAKVEPAPVSAPVKEEPVVEEELSNEEADADVGELQASLAALKEALSSSGYNI